MGRIYFTHDRSNGQLSVRTNNCPLPRIIVRSHGNLSVRTVYKKIIIFPCPLSGSVQINWNQCCIFFNYAAVLPITKYLHNMQQNIAVNNRCYEKRNISLTYSIMHFSWNSILFDLAGQETYVACVPYMIHTQEKIYIREWTTSFWSGERSYPIRH